jgi:hypothetical protein
MPNRKQEGGNCSCGSPEEHARLVASVDESHARDYDGSRRELALQVSTSEALRKRAVSVTNGHYP